VTILGFGGSEIGAESVTPEQVGILLNHALDAGLNVIDTAECYGQSEEKIGQALSGRRDEFFLFTKCGHASGLDYPDWSPELLERSIDRSLQRLRTDCVDLIQLHTCTEELLRQGDVIAVLQRARDAGKTRYIGYSGDNERALYAIACGAFDTLQTSVNIADQRVLEQVLPAAERAGIGVIAKRPIANAAWTTDSPSDYSRPYWERLQELDYPFLKGDPEDGAATALRFTLTAPGVHTAIVGTTRPGRWRQNAAVLNEGLLSGEEFEEIRKRWKKVAEKDWTGQG
jgi:hypothetical protein